MKAKAYRAAAVAGVVFGAVIPAVAAGAVARPLWLGVEEQAVYGGGQGVPLAVSQRIAGTNSRFQRISVKWRELQPDSKFSKPGNLPPQPSGKADPSPAAGFPRAADNAMWDGTAISKLDDAIRASACPATTSTPTSCDTVGAGLEVILMVEDAPSWAQTSERPVGVTSAGAWMPDPVAFGRLATALAVRYDGSHHNEFDPDHNRALPKVTFFQAWNEPNISTHLAPQCEFDSRHNCRRIVSPDSYRQLLGSFHDGLAADASGRSDAVTVSAGLFPNGYPGGTPRPDAVHPQDFARYLLCLVPKGAGWAKSASCPGPTKFDIWSLHPYDLGSSPKRPADPERHRGVMADLPSFRTYLDAAVAVGTALPTGRKPIWITEFGWFTNLPNTGPYGRKEPYASRYAAESLWRAWAGGADALFWFTLRDNLSWMGGGLWYASSYADAGTLTPQLISADRPKPMLRAFQWPFREVPGRVPYAWGMVPCRQAGQSVTVERLYRRSWRRAATAATGPSGTFVAFLPRSGKGDGFWRAVAPPGCGSASPGWNSKW